MKKAGLFLLILFLSCNFAWSQDTLYIYRAGIVVVKRAVSEIDSVTFNKNHNLPVLETVTDLDGNVYHSVKIGTQTWMVENLKTTKYRNGDLIGTTSSLNMDLTYETAPKYQWAYNGVESNVPTYGRLYTWHVVADNRNIAPAGWHVATDAEWAVLQNYLIANGYNYDKTTTGNKIGKSLCSTTLWNTTSVVGTVGYDMTKNNSSGFTMTPGGYRGVDGYFYILGIGTDIWTATENSPTLACQRGCGCNCPDLGANNLNKNYGFTVRCIKDMQTAPILTTIAPTQITDTTATCIGNITSDGGAVITARGICWSTSQNPTIDGSKTTDSTGIGSFTSKISGLTADSTYYVRAYATNSVGTAYGEQFSFKTYPKGSKLVTDIDGNSYLTVTIGTQTWMAENLKTTKYRNGDPISNITDNNAWVSTYGGAYCWYNNDIKNKDTYGAMYNGYTISDSRNIAPAGWHVPTLDEWTTLSAYLGGDTLAGGKLKESGTIHWNSPNTSATNETGFTALPGGQRNKDTGIFNNLGLFGYFWNNTQIDGYDTKQSVLFYNRSNFGPSGCSNSYGSSVRCVKDAQTLPVLTTTAISAITDTTAISGGNITSDGGAAITARGICWNTSQNPTIDDNKTTDSTGIGSFTSKITGLTADSIYYVRAYATNNVGTSYGEQVSFKTSKTMLQTVTDIDGNVYHTVKIGTQTWMVGNLKTTKYRNGDIIPNVTNSSIWAALTTGAWCNYNNDSTNNAKYGKHYNWFTVNDSRNIAPMGWHVATDTDWTMLTTYLGGESVAGGKLKESGTINWKSPNAGATNETNFSALPAGGRGNNDGTFLEIGISSFWWSSTELNSFYAYFRSVGCNGAGVGRSGSGKMNGLAVRCVKDTQTLPILTTTAVSAITDTSAISGGNITSDGGTAITSRGICWSTSQNPTIEGYKTITDSTGTGVFTSKITGLTADSTNYVRAYATNSVGTAYGEQIKFTALHSEKVTDFDGNIYATVKIGSQVWMTENLKVSHYRNGDPITYVTDNAEWASQDGSNSGYGAYCWNKNNITYKDVFGALYNGYAVFDNRNIAPQGWHIPTLVEWQTLFNYLGGDKIANGKLKEIGTLHWDNPNTDATNETCFNGLPTGGRNKSTGIFSDNWRTGGYWTCTETNWDKLASWVAVLFNDPDTNPNPAQTWGCSKAYGNAIRCVKDAQTLPVLTTTAVSAITDSTEL